ncbi:hypothetical protein [Bradyrhizobium sp. USDA 10063]
MMTQSVKMSARKIQEIPSGLITTDQLFANYTRPGHALDNPFARASKQGLTIESVEFTKLSDKDDDEIEIRFGLSDLAVSKFKVDRGGGNK